MSETNFNRNNLSSPPDPSTHYLGTFFTFKKSIGIGVPHHQIWTKPKRKGFFFFWEVLPWNFMEFQEFHG